MGSINPPSPAMLLVAAFSRYPQALEWARQRAVETWGPLADESPHFDFTQTDYYEASMGPGLTKLFWVFQRPFDPGQMAAVKRLTNQWEADYAATAGLAEPRPLNLDPGYISLGKLVLASTKDHSHRIYLSDGIYAEVTLFYRDHRWQAREWTFADYRRADYQEFFSRCRDRLHQRIREEAKS
jgi:hypothetical protein